VERDIGGTSYEMVGGGGGDSSSKYSSDPGDGGGEGNVAHMRRCGMSLAHVW
jgi:hypothetical protein